MLLLDLHLDRPALLVFGLHETQALHPGVGPGLDAPHVFLARAGLANDHDEWHGNRKLLYPIAMTVIDPAIDQR